MLRTSGSNPEGRSNTTSIKSNTIRIRLIAKVSENFFHFFFKIHFYVSGRQLLTLSVPQRGWGAIIMIHPLG